MHTLWIYVAGLLPTVVVAAFFYAIIKRIVESDRNERIAQRRFEEDEDRRARLHENDGRADTAESPENE